MNISVDMDADTDMDMDKGADRRNVRSQNSPQLSKTRSENSHYRY
jgi:hypothetical protein